MSWISKSPVTTLQFNDVVDLHAGVSGPLESQTVGVGIGAGGQRLPAGRGFSNE